MRLDEALAVCPVVAILRGVRPDEIEPAAEALHSAGIRALEVPLNSPRPMESLARLAGAFGGRVAFGAGTVLQAREVDEVAATGGTIIVSPNTSRAVIRRSVELGLDPAPGFATATEAFLAVEAGARHLKLFPAVTYGPGHVRQLTAVLPDSATVWAVGGIGAADLAKWWTAGVRGFGVGSEIYRPGQSAEATLEKARQFVAAARALS
jgi:2-dehydro-3-deoxyphosphogalactonate aldolase